MGVIVNRLPEGDLEFSRRCPATDSDLESMRRAGWTEWIIHITDGGDVHALYYKRKGITRPLADERVTVAIPTPAPVVNAPAVSVLITEQPTTMELVNSSVITRAGGVDAYRAQVETGLKETFTSVWKASLADARMDYVPLPAPREGRERLPKEGGHENEADAA